MGLDQYWTITKKDGSETELAYHRKFNALEGWMRELAVTNGIVEHPNEFNNIALNVTQEILDDLESDVNSGNFKPAQGFFFGEQVIRDEDLCELHRVINESRKELNEGNDIFYSSCW